jgi:ATP-dependent protease ClpP protease subunit
MDKTSDYRPNTQRSIHVVGELSEECAVCILPEVLKLKEQSNDPISVFIHSRGGFVDVFEAIEAGLRVPGYDQDENTDARIITVAVGDVSSAAANLLALGDYAIAYPNSRILFHGIRTGEIHVTYEGAQNMAGHLGMMNRRIAQRIALCIFPRIMFRFFQLRPQGLLSPEKSLEAFRDVVEKRLSAPAKRVLNRSYKRVCDALDMTVRVFTKVKLQPSTAQKIADSRVLRAVLKQELSKTDKTWQLDESGINLLVDHYFMIREFSAAQGHKMFRDATGIYGADFLNKTDSATYQSLSKTDEKKAKQLLFEKSYHHIALLWFYAVTLSHNLFVGENQLWARDAYWLGIIDEVKGTKLLCERIVAEEQEKKEKATASNAP